MFSIFISTQGFPPYEKLFTLVSKLQIPRLNLIRYNSRNWSASSTLISPDEIIFSRDLSCSSVFRISSCKALSYCSLGDLDGFTLGTYDVTELGSPEVSTEVTKCGNLEVLLIGDWLVYLIVLEIGTNVGMSLDYLMIKCLKQHWCHWLGYIWMTSWTWDRLQWF